MIRISHDSGFETKDGSLQFTLLFGGEKLAQESKDMTKDESDFRSGKLIGMKNEGGFIRQNQPGAKVFGQYDDRLIRKPTAILGGGHIAIQFGMQGLSRGVIGGGNVRLDAQQIAAARVFAELNTFFQMQIAHGSFPSIQTKIRTRTKVNHEGTRTPRIFKTQTIQPQRHEDTERQRIFEVQAI
jgi:hypothetical protein